MIEIGLFFVFLSSLNSNENDWIDSLQCGFKYMVRFNSNQIWQWQTPSGMPTLREFAVNWRRKIDLIVHQILNSMFDWLWFTDSFICKNALLFVHFYVRFSFLVSKLRLSQLYEFQIFLTIKIFNFHIIFDSFEWFHVKVHPLKRPNALVRHCAAPFDNIWLDQVTSVTLYLGSVP